jgi:hypothetical protein
MSNWIDRRTHEQDWQELDLLLRGFQISRMLRLVADLGIPDRIAANGAVRSANLRNPARCCQNN